MIIDTSDLDGDALFDLTGSYLNNGGTRWCVAINGKDYEVQAAQRAGIVVRTWCEEKIAGAGDSALIKWDDIETLKIY